MTGVGHPPDFLRRLLQSDCGIESVPHFFRYGLRVTIGRLRRSRVHGSGKPGGNYRVCCRPDSRNKDEANEFPG